MCEAKAVEIILDSGSDSNFVTMESVNQFRLQVIDGERREHQVITGDTFTSDKMAIASFVGKGGKVVESQFHILPQGARVPHMLVGKPFIRDFQRTL